MRRSIGAGVLVESAVHTKEAARLSDLFFETSVGSIT
jgi:hypothetical protein